MIFLKGNALIESDFKKMKKNQNALKNKLFVLICLKEIRKKLSSNIFVKLL